MLGHLCTSKIVRGLMLVHTHTLSAQEPCWFSKPRLSHFNLCSCSGNLLRGLSITSKEKLERHGHGFGHSSPWVLGSGTYSDIVVQWGWGFAVFKQGSSNSGFSDSGVIGVYGSGSHHGCRGFIRNLVPLGWGWSKQVNCPTTGDWQSHCFSINHFIYSSESPVSIQSEDVVVNLPVHVEGLARGSFFDLHITTIFFGGSREVPVPTLQSPVHWHTRDGPRIVYFSSIGHLIPLLLTTVYRAHGPWHSILATHCHKM